MQLGVHNWLQN